MTAGTAEAATAGASAADLEAGRRVLALEAEALAQLGRMLDASFTRALDLLAATTGRVIVSGMGKSGLVGRKIAATLASTGTPAQYVHPGEASHGDLGMIAGGDAILALSNSGETPELADLLAHSRRFAIPLVAITSRPGSTLAQAADVALILPGMPEACPMGLAPTTSTTAMLALGDALAVALLGRKGFTAEQFRVFHPGGKLGKQLQRVGDLMHGAADMPVVATGTRMGDALIVMTARGFGCVVVVDRDGLLCGIVTDGDLRRHMSPHLLDRHVEQVMNQAPKTIRPAALAAEAIGLMNDRKVTQLVVVEGDRPVGMVRMHDLLRAGVA
ncbi:MAG: KpsF/GutQ family sugar-phosphate isomerase [Alphaproteobacteria bacterium]|nr:KpsF/GutQ family sugar-phosphate isomerase [Alphaproteobacteria bacterium]MBM3627880.1 KpsF/GutQ family sugar-phosphate isomerase [Alphaproteobacteria bacterium]